MRKTFSFKLYSSRKLKALNGQINIAASVYNHCIALHRCYYKIFGKYLNKYALQKHLTKLKNSKKYELWNTIGSQAIQDITDRIDRAYQRFFDNVKERESGKIKRIVSPPSFKKRKKYKSLTLKQAGYKPVESQPNKIKIGKKTFKFSKSRDIEGQIKTLTIKRNVLGEIYLFLSCELPETQVNRTMTGKSAGFDFGLKTFLTSSDDFEIESPLFFKQAQRDIAWANKNLSRKKRGSGHRHKARLQLARIHEQVANQRKDYQFKLAKKLALTYDVLFFEDLNIEAMKRIWGKKISDLGFSDFIKILKYICLQVGSKIQFIDRFYPSSKECHQCRFIKVDLSLKDRIWECPECHIIHDRDKNAALNIFREGASSLGLGNVRPPQSVAISV
jgi:putative transposase